jgi:hypothetical protein
MRRKASKDIAVPFLVTVILATALLIALPAVLKISSRSGADSDSVPKAAIVDQLGILYPNPELIQGMSEELEACGFNVTVFSKDEVSVDLYSRLPEYDFHLIVFRAHSDIIETDKNTYRTILNTNESYSKYEYTLHQLSDRVISARAIDSEDVNFVISSDFISGFDRNSLDGSVIIVMGCGSLASPDMARAFVDKGALAYVGWNERVSLHHIDDVTLNLLHNLCSNKLSIKESLARTIEEKGVDPEYKSYPLYYPKGGGSYGISTALNCKQ